MRRAHECTPEMLEKCNPCYFTVHSHFYIENYSIIQYLYNTGTSSVARYTLTVLCFLVTYRTSITSVTKCYT